jgi:thioredoxin 1
MAGGVLEVNDKNFDNEVLKSTQPVVVDFWATWCMPCKMVAPVIDETAMELGDKIKFAKFNIDDNASVPAKYSVMSIPTLLFFKDGELLESNVGVVSKEELVNKIEEVFA